MSDKNLIPLLLTKVGLENQTSNLLKRNRFWSSDENEHNSKTEVIDFMDVPDEACLLDTKSVGLEPPFLELEPQEYTLAVTGTLNSNYDI